jgi:hypothetical protein
MKTPQTIYPEYHSSSLHTSSINLSKQGITKSSNPNLAKDLKSDALFSSNYFNKNILSSSNIYTSKFQKESLQPPKNTNHFENLNAIELNHSIIYPSDINDLNLVLTEEKFKNGFKIKKFREYNRVDFESDSKSLSMFSINSESSRIQANQFNVLDLNTNNSKNELRNFKAKNELRTLKTTNNETFITLPNIESQAKCGYNNSLNASCLSSKLSSNSKTKKVNHEKLEATLSISANNLAQHANEIKEFRTLSVATIELNDVGLFKGELLNGLPNGYGSLWNDKRQLVYEGYFVDGNFKGIGVIYNNALNSASTTSSQNLADQTIIAIDFLESIAQRFEGHFADNKRKGIGHLIIDNDFEYVSDFENDRITGKGTLVNTRTNTINEYMRVGCQLEKMTQ